MIYKIFEQDILKIREQVASLSEDVSAFGNLATAANDNANAAKSTASSASSLATTAQSTANAANSTANTLNSNIGKASLWSAVSKFEVITDTNNNNFGFRFWNSNNVSRQFLFNQNEIGIYDLSNNSKIGTYTSYQNVVTTALENAVDSTFLSNFTNSSCAFTKCGRVVEVYLHVIAKKALASNTQVGTLKAVSYQCIHMLCRHSHTIIPNGSHSHRVEQYTPEVL